MYSSQDFTHNFRGNLFGGMTAAIVALPLALAFGIASGAGPVAGIYGAALVGLFAAVFGGTPTQISGPTGPMTVVMTAMTTHYMALYPEQGLTLAFTTVFLGGCVQILFGLLRVGKYIIMVPYPVISGFMTGIGVIIILLQLGPLLGFDSPSTIAAAVTALPAYVADFSTPALTTGVVTLAIVFLWRGRAGQILPAPLLALVGGTALSLLLFEPGAMQRIGEIPSALPNLQVPTVRLDELELMITNALMLAVLGSIDSLLTSLVADSVTGTQHQSDRELVGQGIGNAIAGLLGGIPGAGATMRTMVNIRAGASGPLSGVTHAGILFAGVLGLGFLFASIPLAALAGILIKVGIDIIDWPFLQRLHRLPRFPALLMMTVLLLTVFVDLITAVFVGVFIKNLVTIDKLSDLQLGMVVFSNGLHDADRLPEPERRALASHEGEVLLVRITGPISYAVGRGLTQRFRQNLGDAKLLLIDIADASIIGISSTLVLEDFVRKALSTGVTVKLIGVQADQHRELQQMGLVDLVGRANCVASVEAALGRHDSRAACRREPRPFR